MKSIWRRRLTLTTLFILLAGALNFVFYRAADPDNYHHDFLVLILFAIIWGIGWFFGYETGHGDGYGQGFARARNLLRTPRP